MFGQLAMRLFDKAVDHITTVFAERCPHAHVSVARLRVARHDPDRHHCAVRGVMRGTRDSLLKSLCVGHGVVRGHHHQYRIVAARDGL